ncbi:MAG: cytochrome c maturation protein CcmE [Chloroflexi bacterium]|nr:cytochrome c maturation protein CcmE [Chloroflexota bacterium]
MRDSASAAEIPLARSRARSKFLIGGLLIVVAVAYLIITAARGSTAYYLTVAELKAQGATGRQVRVAGYVIGESIVWSAQDLRLEFDLQDDSGTLPVIYIGARPDMFRDGAEVVVEGRYNEQGVFEAGNMLLKCPSKYEEAAKDG